MGVLCLPTQMYSSSTMYGYIILYIELDPRIYWKEKKMFYIIIKIYNKKLSI